MTFIRFHDFDIFTENHGKVKFHEKGARRRPGDLKRHGIPLPTQAFPASGRQGAKKRFLPPKSKKKFSDFAKIHKFHEIHEIFRNFMISDMSESLVFLRKYYRFLKKQGPHGGPGPQKCVFGCNTALFRFLGPQRAPLAKPFINVTFWGRFWRPRRDFSPRNKNLGENHVLEPKSNFLLKT